MRITSRESDEKEDPMKPLPTRRALRTGLVAGLTAPLLLASCGGDDDAASGGAVETITTVDYYSGVDEGAVVDMLDSCGEEVGVEIDRTYVPGASLIQKVLQQASSQTLPDVLMLDNPDLQQIAESGALAPLSDFDISSDGYAEGILDAGTYDGEVYGLAPTVNTIALFYDEKVLADEGVEPPQTWDELRTAAEQLTDGDRYGLALDANATYEGSWTFLPFLWSNGGSEDDLESTQAAEALQLWTDLIDDGSVSESALNWSQDDVMQQFMAGNAAMMVNGPWQIPGLSEQKDLDYGVVQIPVPDESATAVAPLGGEVWTVPLSDDPERMEVAGKVVKCLLSDESQLELGEKRHTVPSKPELADAYLEAAPDMKTFVDLVADARSRTGILGEEWPETATTIYTGIQLALTDQADPDEAFAEAAEQ